MNRLAASMTRVLALATALVAGTFAGIPPITAARAATACPPGLLAWCTALGSASTRPANMMVIGDSIAQGFYASSRSGRWIDMTRSRLQADYGGSGTGYVPASEAGPDGFNPSVWTDRGGHDSTDGLGARSYTIDSAGGYAQATVNADRLQLSYTASPSGGAMRILIDGTQAARVDTYDPAGTMSSRTWLSPALAPGGHTVTVVADDTGTLPVYSVTVEGVMVFDGDYGSGVHLWDGSHIGYDSSQFATSPDLGAATEEAQPDLLVLELGINDLTHQIPPAEFESDLVTIISSVESHDSHPCPVVLMPMWNATFQAPDVYSQYLAAEEDLAATAGYPVADLSQVLAGTYTADGAHSNRYGQQVAADRLLRVVDPDYSLTQPPLPGPPADPLQLAPPTVPASPQNVLQAGAGSDGIAVSWHQPTDGSGPYDCYWVELVDVSGGAPGVPAGLQSTGALSAEFAPPVVEAGHSYVAEVIAANTAGTSPISYSGIYSMAVPPPPAPAPAPTPGVATTSLIPPTQPAPNPTTTAGGSGYRLVAADGGVFSFGSALFYGSPGGTALTQPVVAAAPDPATGGYWLVGRDGGVFAYHAPYFGSTGGDRLTAPVVAAAAAPDGRGYWLFAADGGVFAFGDAGYYGSTAGVGLTAPVVAAAATPDGLGYWLVAADGGVFAFGDARFQGSTAAVHLERPIAGLAVDGRTGGYWLVASDGGVFAFDAPFLGSTGGLPLRRPITGVAASPGGQGYTLVGADGGVFAFGTAVFSGSVASATLNGRVVAIELPD